MSTTPAHFSSRKRLSCTSCRQRKIKCDKADPCDQCLELGIGCIFPTRRIRAPRNKGNALNTRDAELLRRISRLEGLLANKADVRPTGFTPTLIQPLLSSGVLGEDTQPGLTADGHYAAFVKQQVSGVRHLNGEFWSSLSNEFDGLRELIGCPAEDEDECDESITQVTEEVDCSPSFILQGPESSTTRDIVYPSDAHSAILFQFYFTNVDPVCKILHRPTVTTYFSNMEVLLDPFTRRFKFRSIEAVTFAAYFAAVVSMSSQECLTYFSEDRDVLVGRYKHITETALVQANFLISLEITTLQALVIYIMAQSSLDKGRFRWTLIGLAVRIAHGAGLHQDGDGHSFSAFESEMRRRIWWQILALDMRASEDRGSEPILAEGSFNTAMPCNLNDNELKYNSQHPLHSGTGPTEMTLSLLGVDALCTSQKINPRSLACGSNNLTLEERQGLIKEYAKRVELKYLAGCDFSDQRMRLLRTIGNYWICRLWLNLYYPLQHQVLSHQVQSRCQGLQMAVTFLNVNELIERHLSSAGFAWLNKTFAPWHAVAVTLAELCSQSPGPLADRAWETIERCFLDWSGRAADNTKEAMLWCPIKVLLKKARLTRQDRQDSINCVRGSQPSDLELTLQGLNIPEFSNPDADGVKGINTLDCMALNNFDLIDQTTGQYLDFLSFTPLDMMDPLAGSSSMPNNLDDWDNFTFDVNALGGEFLVDPFDL